MKGTRLLGNNEIQFVSDELLAIYITTLHKNDKSPATIGQVLAAVKWQLKYQLQKTVNFPITQATLAGIRRDFTPLGTPYHQKASC